MSLFGEAGADLTEPRLPNTHDWDPPERLAEEFKAVGFYLTGHPLEDVTEALRRPTGMWISRPLLRADPSWAPLRGHPGFERLIADHRGLPDVR